MPSVTQTAPIIEAVLVLPFLLMGLSHLVRPAMWREYFVQLHQRGTSALITRSFAFEIWPALLLVVFHQVWSGPAVILTVYGHILALKVVLSLIFPEIGMRSLAMAKRGDQGFRMAGAMLLGLGGISLYTLLTSAP